MQVFRGLFFVERKFIFWGVRIYFLRARSGGWEEGFWKFMRQFMRQFMNIHGGRKGSDGGKECRVGARFAGTASFDIKRECEKNYANYTLNYTFR